MTDLVEESNVEGEAELILEPYLVRELVAQLASRCRRIGQQRLEICKKYVLQIYRYVFVRKKPLFIKKINFNPNIFGR
jgi:hypothetical protein